MMILVRLLRASFVAFGAIAVFAVCDDLPTGPGGPEVPRFSRPMLNTTGSGSAVLVAAGDIAQCNTSNPTTLNDERTALLVRSIPEATVATLGDHSNVATGSFITSATYTSCYGPSWGTSDILSRTRPTPGNRDWNAPAGSTPGQVYFDYFNGTGASDGPAGPRDKGYYAYDVGTWRVIALNNNISMTSTSPQYLWLKAELEANPAACTIAYWHAPLFFSSGTTIRSQVKPLWDLLYAAGAEIILNSDNAFYERFAPQTPNGVADQNFGIREFIVGTGGIGTATPLSPPRANSERVISGTFGILKLTLHENGYDWNFLNIPERPIAEPEAGSGTCHGSPLPRADANGPYASEKTVIFDGRGSVDPQGETLTYEWNFGDNSTHVGSQPADATPTHTYASNGVYTVTLTVIDPNGERSQPATTTATIGNIAPSVHAGVDISTIPNSPVTVRALFSDPGLEDAAWSYSIDWGDGSQPTTGTLPTQDDPVVGTHTYSVAGTYSVSVSVTDKDGGIGSDVVSVQVSDQPTGTYVLTGAGDIAECNTARVSEKTAKILKATPGTVFTLGDNAYPDGTAQQYRDCYGPGWGDPTIKSRTFPTLGNHDYNTPGAIPSFDYFGAAVGPRGKGYYSYDLGPWHVIVLNNNNGNLVPSSPGSAQFEWFKDDLARSAATSRCTIIMAHEPYVYSPTTVDGDGTHPKHKPIWEEAYKWGVEIILSGDVHRYERFRPQSPETQADDAYGIRQFLVGTGGGGTGMPGTIRVHSEAVSAAHGVLRLTLEPDKYTWKFIAIEGQTFTDEGSGTCHDPKPTGPVNQAPQANADAYTVAEDNALAVTSTISAIGISGVLANDTDADGDALTAALRSGTGPSNGTLELNTDGTFIYTPSANFNGTDQFTYEASDGKGGTAAATVTLTVTAVNDAPVAQNDPGYGVAEGQTLTVAAASGVLVNDNDVEGSALTAELVQGPGSGTLTLNSDGSFTYTPNVGFSGNDSFQYRASDGGLHSNSATVTIGVTDVNNAPIAVDDPNHSVDEDGTLALPLSASVLANDTDSDGDGLQAELVSGPTNGTLALIADGTFTYTPSANFNGSDSFTYRAGDGALASNVATVTITVTAVNDAPVANAGSVSTPEDTPVAVTLTGSDVDGDALSFAIVFGPAHGVLAAGESPGTYTYTPAANFTGSDEFTFTAADGSTASAAVTLTIDVGGVNDAPVAADNAYTTDEDTPLTVPAAGILTNDSDVDGDALEAELVSGPAHGTLTLSANGSFTYTPSANFSGSDSFTYRARDGALGSNVATVSLTITAVNDAPVATADSYTAREDEVLNIAAPGVLANDADADGASSAELVARPANGTLTLAADGSFTYTPNAGFNGEDVFSYRAFDGTAYSGIVTVTLEVSAVNDAPAANAGSVSTAEDTPVAITLTGSDPDGDPLTFTVATSPAGGSLTPGTTPGTYTYTPGANFNGPDEFTFTAADGNARSAPATVSISVAPVNDAPSFVKGDDQTVLENAGPQTTTGWATAISAGANEAAQSVAFEVIANTNPSLFSAAPAVSPAGVLTYTPALGVNGSATITVVLRDNGGTADGGIDASSPQSFTITVSSVNSAPGFTPGASQTVGEDSGPQSVLGWATQITAGANESDQTLTFEVTTTNEALFSASPVIDAATGELRYTPAPDKDGTATVTVILRDNGGIANGGVDRSPTVTFTITVSPTNDAPVATADGTYGTTEETTLIVSVPGVLANDSDIDGDPLTATIVAQPSRGTVTLNADGSFTYTPNADFNGGDSFTYLAADPNGGASEVRTVSIEVTAVNDAPALEPITERDVSEGAQVSFTAVATDPDASVLTYSLVGAPAGATINDASGVFTWTPTEAQGPGRFTFTVRVQDDASPPVSQEKLVTINVTEANVAPVVSAGGAKTVVWGSTLTFRATATDADQPANVLTFSLPNAPTGATIDGSTGDFSWKPNDTQGPGTYQITVRVSDGALNADEQINVTVSNAVPTLTSLSSGSAQAQASAPDFQLDVIGAGFSPTSTVQWEGTTLSTTFVSATKLTATVPGSRVGTVGTYYVRVFNGAPGGGTSAKLAFFVTDAAAGVTSSDVATSNDPAGTAEAKTAGASPNDATVEAVATGTGTVAVAQYSSNPGGSASFEATGLWFDVNVEQGSSFEQVVISFCNVGDGTMVRWWNPGTGAWELVEPAAVLSGSCLRMTVTSASKPSLSDLRGDYFSIARNAAPNAVNDAVSVAEDTPVSINVVANDSDVDGDALSATLVSSTSHGTLVHNADGSFSYTPEANFSGTDSFVYRASDGVRASANATVTITVTPVNDAPVAAADSYVADEDKELTVTGAGVLANDTDVDAGQVLRASLVSGPSNGTLVLNQDGSLTYTPRLHFSGTDAFIYRASDGIDNSGSVTVTITVRPRMTVTVDMVPGSSTNSIGYSTTQTQVVFAIVSSATFDATLVDPSTVTLGDDKGTDTPLARNADGTFKVMLTDVNGDGRRDLYAFVNKSEMKANGDLTLTTTTLTALGRLKAPRSDLFRGKDKVTVVP